MTVSMALPPCDTSGSGTPPTGMAPVTMAVLTKQYMLKLNAIPSASSRPYWLRQRSAISTPPATMAASSAISPSIPTSPNSSASTAWIKSVCFSGKKFRCPCVPCRKPLPHIPPEPSAILLWMMLYPAPSGSLSGFMNVVMRARW